MKYILKCDQDSRILSVRILWCFLTADIYEYKVILDRLLSFVQMKNFIIGLGAVPSFPISYPYNNNSPQLAPPPPMSAVTCLVCLWHSGVADIRHTAQFYILPLPTLPPYNNHYTKDIYPHNHNTLTHAMQQCFIIPEKNVNTKIYTTMHWTFICFNQR